MRNLRRHLSPLRRAAFVAAPCALGLVLARDAAAQTATYNKPMPNVLLLIDTSGSMERMPDNSLPSDNRDPANPAVPLTTSPNINKCARGVESNPNRWGMLLQALTGNMAPFYSCEEMPRNRNGALFNEFKINGQAPYDTDYILPYHRPLSGPNPADACAFAPWRLPGGGGVGSGNNSAGGNAGDFPVDAFRSMKMGALASFNGPGPGSDPAMAAANLCVFDQASDGQLDVSRDYIRFGLMTFDSDTDPGTGVSTVNPPPGGGGVGANPFLGNWTYVAQNPPILAAGQPANCATTSPFDVGARHWAAPPWEGRMVMFPDPLGSLYDIQRTNEQIQKVLLGTRPWGATPIAGLVADAQDYLWRHAYGPNQNQVGFADPYAKGGCRDQFIILLTDGAPNLDLRPSCQGPGGQCPYPFAKDTVNELFQGAGGNPKVTTYVIGFSVNGSGQFPGDGFPAPYNAPPGNTCKDWFNGPLPNGANRSPQELQNKCNLAPPPPGSTADACCKLNEIAFAGSGGLTSPATAVGPFFAETQSDLTLAFGRILGNVTKSVASRTVPGQSPAVASGGAPVSATYSAAFVPNAQSVWSGEIGRARTVCSGVAAGPATYTVNDGDSYAANTAAQTAAHERFFFSVKPNTIAGAYDAMGSIRPYVGATPAYNDSIPAYGGVEVGGLDRQLAAEPNWADVLGIDDNTCKRSKAPAVGGGTTLIPRLTKSECKEVVWGFSVATPDLLNYGGYGGFNVRCKNSAAGFTAGKCSVTGGNCTIAGPPCPTAGETCVPECAALGAIFRASPVVVGAPAPILREDAYRGFVEGRSGRRPTLFAATIDGILHAFRALDNTVQGNNPPGSNWEMWNFIPPAVLPKLASNYPSGTQILLDGTPVVKEMVWDRPGVGDRSQWHTTLVAGLGQGGGGYYALNVSDSDCSPGAPPGRGLRCTPALWQAAGGVNIADVSAGGALDNSARRGPHFLWQLTDVLRQGAELTKVTRRAPDGEHVALFGSQTGTPALTTVLANPDGTTTREIGIAILPGGIDGPPVKNGLCARQSGAINRSDPLYPPRASVRQWAASCAAPVAGRGVTIVRADTGEILRHFGRRTQDVPVLVQPQTTDTPFDSPMVGTPIVYPSNVGAIGQRVYIGDADGTMWMIDISKPLPTDWRAYLLQDLIPPPGTFDSAQPITLPPVATLDPTGQVILNVATGDQENILASTQPNFVYAIKEEGPNLLNGFLPRGKVQWFLALPNGERVTGPMAVFDRTLYYATHAPEQLGSICSGSARSRLWGVDFSREVTPGNPATGPGARWCPIGSTDPVTGVCAIGAYVRSEDILSATNAIIPGVAIKPILPCSTFGALPDDPTGGITGFSASSGAVGLSFNPPSVPVPGPGQPMVPPPQVKMLQAGRSPSSIDAWAIVVD